jgi:CBS domain-containing protein
MPDLDVFDRPVASYMSTELETAQLESSVDAIARAMHTRGVSGVPILDADDWLAGVVTRTDLIRIGVLQAGRRVTSAAMPLPHRRAKDIMKHQPLTIAAAATVRDAARMMTEHAIHRLFVLDGERLAGVIAAIDLARVVRDAGIERELSTIMTSPIVTVDIRSPIGAATEQLEHLRVTQLIVTDEGQPVGVFAQADALATRDLPRGTPLETVYDAAVLCLPATTKLCRAAAHVAELDVRRVIVSKDREAIGIATALDFARFVAT